MSRGSLASARPSWASGPGGRSSSAARPIRRCSIRLVLWVAFNEIGRRTGKAYDAVGKRAIAFVHEGRDAPNAELGAAFRAPKALWLHIASLAVVALFLLDMTFKPGA